MPATLKSHLANVPFQNLKRRSALASIRRDLSVVPIESETVPANTEPTETHTHTSDHGIHPDPAAKLATSAPPATVATRNDVFSPDERSTPWL